MRWGKKKCFFVSFLPGLGKHWGQSDIKNSDLYKRRKGSIFSKEFKIKESGNTLIRNVLNLQKENYRIPWRHIKCIWECGGTCSMCTWTGGLKPRKMPASFQVICRLNVIFIKTPKELRTSQKSDSIIHLENKQQVSRAKGNLKTIKN